MSSHLQVPLKNLRFGHEAPEHPSNARVTGRLDGIEALAANIHSRGQIEDLIVFDDGVADDDGEPVYFVSDGNRSLAALRLIYSETSSEPIDCKLRPAETAFEDSLAVAVMAHKLHPVDEFEGFARLRDDYGKSSEEIAQQYGLSEREVAQVLALGALSPTIREAWRRGELKSKAAKAFTLAADHAAQDELYAKLKQRAGEYGEQMSSFDDNDVKEELEIDAGIGALVEFVGIDAYVARGGVVTRDLFGVDHDVSDRPLAQKMADERLATECKRLVEAGWAFAVTKASVRNSHFNYGALKVEPEPTPEEAARLAELEKTFGHYDEYVILQEMTAAEQRAFLEHREIKQAIAVRSYTPKLMATAGCFVDIDDNGMLGIEYGRVKPKQKEAAARAEKEERRAPSSRAAAGEDEAPSKPAPEPKVISNALRDRLESQLIAATRDAIAAEPQLSNSPLFETLAKVICAQIIPDSPFRMPDAVRTKLPTIRQVLNAGVFNTALVKRFDAENYFASAPKGFVLKAIGEAINPDEARKVASKSKVEIAKFALANLGRTGWLPKELRTVHYKGPGSEGYKKPPAAPSLATAMGDALEAAEKALKTSPARSIADKVKAAKAEREVKKNDIQMKRAASAKKSATKKSKR